MSQTQSKVCYLCDRYEHISTISKVPICKVCVAEYGIVEPTQTSLADGSQQDAEYPSYPDWHPYDKDWIG